MPLKSIRIKQVGKNAKFSVVVPVYMNSASIPDVVSRLEDINNELDGSLEAIFVVDGSPDDSFARLKALLPSAKLRSRVLSHSRNFGSFAAVRTGFSVASGQFIAVMAADLQEPKHLIIDFFDELQKDNTDVVLGVRKQRSDPLLTRLASRVFWGIYRTLIQPEIPKGGVDVFAVRRNVAETLVSFSESNSSLVGQLFWVGYNRKSVFYSRLTRKHGKSSWSFSAKLRYLNDSIYSFTSLPITIILTIGIFGTFASLLAGFGIFFTWLLGGIEVPGYTAQILVQLLSTGSLLFALGVIGTYVWRTYENSKQRPLSIVMRDESF
jgi:glycosyltransferase involved in cell wall biosynthesis